LYCNEEGISLGTVSHEVEKVFADFAAEQQQLVSELTEMNRDLFAQVKDAEEAMEQAILKHENKKTNLAELKATLQLQQDQKTSTKRLQKDERAQYAKNLNALTLENEDANKIDEIVKLCQELHSRTEEMTGAQKMLVLEADAVSATTASTEMQETATSGSTEPTWSIKEASTQQEA
jgi:hypothetical protein